MEGGAMTRGRLVLDSSGASVRNGNRRARPVDVGGAAGRRPTVRALDEPSSAVGLADLDVPTAPTAAVSGRRVCGCGPGPTAAVHCLCSHDPKFLGVLGTIETGEQRRQRFVRSLAAADRILRAVSDNDATLAHVVPLHTSDIGSVLRRWTLNLAVPCRASAADAWWQGYPVRWIRTLQQAPWLLLAARRGGVRLVDERIELAVVDVFLATRGGPMEILVGSVHGARAAAPGADERPSGTDT
jgi:hypothetical protein